MTTLLATKLEAQGKPLGVKVDRNARQSAHNRQKRPYPASRHEADEMFRPNSPMAQVATMPRLARLLRLGALALVPPGTGRITNLEAHQAILDALYDEHGQLRVDA